MIEFSFKFFFQSKHEVRVLGNNLKQGSRALKGIKSTRTEKTECDQTLLQEVVLIQE